MTAMTTQSDQPAPSVGRFRWVILGILFCATTTNYTDRFLLGVLKPTIMQDLHWRETDCANVIFCFQLAYAIGLLTVSWFIDRLGVRAGLALVVGMCNAKLVGFVLDKTHSYAIPFVIASCSYLVAFGILHLLLPRLEPMELEEIKS
jgi:MFS transporter, ACS family, aldohexuronate transporter